MLLLQYCCCCCCYVISTVFSYTVDTSEACS
jgi:hypothetical protein